MCTFTDRKLREKIDKKKWLKLSSKECAEMLFVLKNLLICFTVTADRPNMWWRHSFFLHFNFFFTLGIFNKNMNSHIFCFVLEQFN